MKDKRLYHSVADKITKLVDDGVYPPGSRLPGERELAEQFGVSRVTIREAEIALQATGLLRIKTGSGVYILDPADRDSKLPDVSAFELTEARALFEAEAAALAARRIDDETLAHLDVLIEMMSSSDPKDEEASQEADREFHLTIAAACGNTAIQYVIQSLWKMRTELPAVKEVHAAICHDEDAADRGSEHADVLTALRDHDPEAAREAMRGHFRRLLGSMIDITEEMALEELRKKTAESRQRYLDGVVHSRSA